MIFILFLTVHIIGGSLALIAGGIAAVAKKGHKAHRRGGRFFSYSMVVTALSAILLSGLHPNSFLLGIGIFSLYLTLSGWIWVQRISQKRKIARSRIVGFFGIGSALFLLSLALTSLPSVNFVLLVFGSIQLLFALVDLKKVKDIKDNIARHGGRIGGAYISALTAFMVVNITFLPVYVLWLSPSLIGALLIAFRLRKWQKKMDASAKSIGLQPVTYPEKGI